MQSPPRSSTRTPSYIVLVPGRTKARRSGVLTSISAVSPFTGDAVPLKRCIR